MLRISAMGESCTLYGAIRSDRKLHNPASPAIASRLKLGGAAAALLVYSRTVLDAILLAIVPSY